MHKVAPLPPTIPLLTPPPHSTSCGLAWFSLTYVAALRASHLLRTSGTPRRWGLCRHFYSSPFWGPRDSRGSCGHLDPSQRWGQCICIRCDRSLCILWRHTILSCALSVCCLDGAGCWKRGKSWPYVHASKNIFMYTPQLDLYKILALDLMRHRR